MITWPAITTRARIDHVFNLGDDELLAIDALDAGNRLGPHPDELN